MAYTGNRFGEMGSLIGGTIQKIPAMRKADDLYENDKELTNDLSNDLKNFAQALTQDKASMDLIHKHYGKDVTGFNNAVSNLTARKRKGKTIEDSAEYIKRTKAFTDGLMNLGVDVPMLVQMSSLGNLSPEQQAQIKGEIKGKRDIAKWKKINLTPPTTKSDAMGILTDNGLDANSPQGVEFVNSAGNREVGSIINTGYKSTEEFDKDLTSKGYDPTDKRFAQKREDVDRKSFASKVTLRKFGSDELALSPFLDTIIDTDTTYINDKSGSPVEITSQTLDKEKAYRALVDDLGGSINSFEDSELRKIIDNKAIEVAAGNNDSIGLAKAIASKGGGGVNENAIITNLRTTASSMMKSNEDKVAKIKSAMKDMGNQEKLQAELDIQELNDMNKHYKDVWTNARKYVKEVPEFVATPANTSKALNNVFSSIKMTGSRSGGSLSESFEEQLRKLNENSSTNFLPKGTRLTFKDGKAFIVDTDTEAPVAMADLTEYDELSKRKKAFINVGSMAVGGGTVGDYRIKWKNPADVLVNEENIDKKAENIPIVGKAIENIVEGAKKEEGSLVITGQPIVAESIDVVTGGIKDGTIVEGATVIFNGTPRTITQDYIDRVLGKAKQ